MTIVPLKSQGVSRKTGTGLFQTEHARRGHLKARAHLPFRAIAAVCSRALPESLCRARQEMLSAPLEGTAGANIFGKVITPLKARR